MISTQQIYKAVGLLAIASFIRDFLGIASKMLIAAKFGATSQLDDYVISLTIPNLVSEFLFGGVKILSFLKPETSYTSLYRSANVSFF